MDANGLRFWMLSDRHHWLLGSGADYDEARQRLRLLSRRQLPVDVNGSGAENEARVALDKVPQAMDRYGTRAFWDGDAGAIGAVGGGPGAVRLRTLPEAPTDLLLGHDGVLYVIVGGEVLMHDLRGRWPDVTLSLPGFEAWRATPHPRGGVWVLDRVNQQLARVTGEPIPEAGRATYTDCTARPCEENPTPPRMALQPRVRWTGEAVALAASPEGTVALVLWHPGQDAGLATMGSDATVRPLGILRGIQFPHSLAWISEHGVAMRLSRLPTEALVFQLHDALIDQETAARPAGEPPVLEPSGDVYPLRRPLGGPFVHTLAAPPHYPTIAGSSPLFPLSAPAYADTGAAFSREPLDSGSATTVWHRLYVEASIPARTGVRVMLATSDDRLAAPAAEDWHEHRLGTVPNHPADPGFAVPTAAWVPMPSEIPFHEGFLGCEGVADRMGLFTVLVQRPSRPVRSLGGRFLHVRLELIGDGLVTPEIAALRAYGSRFSYVQNYLPTLYHEGLFGTERNRVLAPPAEGAGGSSAVAAAPTWNASTGADFLERYLGSFEGVLTTLEDRISHAYVLTDPRTANPEALEWLASWIGAAFDQALPDAQRREFIKAAPYLHRRRGTLRALEVALGLATGGAFRRDDVVGGAVERGSIVFLEDWRLRRTFATILGADLADEDDPLLAGLAVSGNSFVGDTLFLGEEHQKEFLALFSANLPLPAADTEAIDAFLDGLAYRITVLVHEALDADTFRLVRRVVDAQKPAHVAALVAYARYPLLVGLASLVGIDTYLREPVGKQPVALNGSALGEDFLMGPASLDPRLRWDTADPVLSPPEPPVAHLIAPATAGVGESFDLDGRASRAAPGRSLDAFRWTRLT